MKVDVKKINLKENDIPLAILGIFEEAKEDFLETQKILPGEWRGDSRT